MNKQEFLKALADELCDFSAEERTQALQFYTEYFEEAGAENEDAVLQELGSPKKVAQILRANCRDVHAAPEAAPNPKPKAASEPADPAGFSGPKYEAPPEYAHTPYDYSQPLPRQQRTGTAGLPLTIILLVVTFPIWFSLAAALLSIVLAVFITLFALVIAGLAIAGAGLICIFSSIRLFFLSASTGTLMLGLSLCSIGAGVLMAIGFCWCLSKACLFIFNACRSLWQYVSLKVRNLL